MNWSCCSWMSFSFLLTPSANKSYPTILSIGFVSSVLRGGVRGVGEGSRACFCGLSMALQSVFVPRCRAHFVPPSDVVCPSRPAFCGPRTCGVRVPRRCWRRKLCSPDTSPRGPACARVPVPMRGRAATYEHEAPVGAVSRPLPQAPGNPPEFKACI